MRDVLVVAPHPDDETLGCGGTLLKHKDQGDNIHWMIVTGMKEEYGFPAARVMQREQEIGVVSESYPFDSVEMLGYPPARLHPAMLNEMVDQISRIFRRIKPHVLYLPYPGDAHTDHRVVFDAAVACTKWFRHPYVKRVLVYETLSETDFGMRPEDNGFRPNVFVDISGYLGKKLEIMETFASEMADFPFPRSRKAIESLAALRGAAAGVDAAEAFMLVKEIVE